VPKVSEAHREQRRTQILDGARRAFATHGFHETTVAQLEDEIGLSRGAIFSYFPSKLELFHALAQVDQERLVHLWLDGWENVIRHLVEDDPEWIGAYLDVSRMLRNDPELRRRWEQRNPELNEQLERSFVARVEAGEIRADVPLDTIGRFIGIVFDGLAIQLGAGFGDPIDLEGTLELLRSALAPK
jgi:AcrR family transcriptional regulator